MLWHCAGDEGNTITAIIIFLAISTFAQDNYFTATRKQIDAQNSSLNFVKSMSEDKTRSAKVILNNWETNCGESEPVFRAKILWGLKAGQFNDSLFSKMSINHILNYKSRMKGVNTSDTYWYDSREAYYGYVPPGQDFDNYTRDLAAELKKNYPEETIEYILAEFYSTQK